MNRQWILRVVALALGLVAAEAICYAGLLLLDRRYAVIRETAIAAHFDRRVRGEAWSSRFTGRDPSKLAQRTSSDSWDAELGWVFPPGAVHSGRNRAGQRWEARGDAEGARVTPGAPPGVPAGASYGDSFTFGVGVNAADTWQAKLAPLVGGSVRNFGVPGYGVLQAILLWERHAAKDMVEPVTVLMVYPPDLTRTISGFRPFRVPDTPRVLGFKPWARWDGDRVVYGDSAWQDRSQSITELQAAALELAIDDPYAGRFVAASAPYSLRLLQAIQGAWAMRDPMDLWLRPEGQELFLSLVDRFASSARAAGSEPLLVMLPDRRALEQHGLSAANDAVARVRAELDLVVVNFAEEPFDPERFLTVPGKGHTSPYGNRVIAEAIARAWPEDPVL